MQARLMLWPLSLVMVFGALFGVYQYGRHVEGLERDAAQKKSIEAAVAKANKLAAADKAAAVASALKEAERHAAEAPRMARVERSILTRTEYLACTLDAADLAELNAAVEGK